MKGFLRWFAFSQRDREDNGRTAWRRAWATAVEQGPGPDAVRDLEQRLEALPGLPEDLEVEWEMLDGLVHLAELVASTGRSGLPTLDTRHRAVGSEACHFSAPASMPDDERQPSGRMLWTSRRALFVGGGSLAVPWHTVTGVGRAERDILLMRSIGQPDVLRFRCNSYADALCGAHLAAHLARGPGEPPL